VERTHNVDLLIVGSRPEAPDGRVILASSVLNTIENATCPVLILARGVPVAFAARVAIA
jgi:nucleotide-binding universal stress UspA family protein